MKNIKIGKTYKVTRENRRFSKVEKFTVRVKGIEDRGDYLYINYDHVYDSGERFGEFGLFGACRVYADDSKLAIHTKFEETAMFKK